jgi:hypothetical protein
VGGGGGGGRVGGGEGVVQGTDGAEDLGRLRLLWSSLVLSRDRKGSWYLSEDPGRLLSWELRGSILQWAKGCWQILPP